MTADAMKAKYKVRITKINEGDTEPFEVVETEGTLSEEQLALLFGGDYNGIDE